MKRGQATFSSGEVFRSLHEKVACPLFLATFFLVACGAPPSPPGPAPIPDAGVPTAIVAPTNAWSWVPVDGSECALGGRAGLGVNLSGKGDDVFIYLQGGGGCWNGGTCAPSLVEFGPVCDYAQACLLNVSGGTQPTATYVDESDPFPADGGGQFPGQLKQLKQSAAFDRSNTGNPFRDASFFFVPYCTGDVHSGVSQASYPIKKELFGPISYRTIRFSGARNMDVYLARLKLTFPNAKRVWLTGSSAGAFGAWLNFERVKNAFPKAEVHMLADSAPLLENPYFSKWKEAWSMQLPKDCADCDAGFPQVFQHLTTAYPTVRFGFVGYAEDPVISWFMYHSNGAASLQSPPLGTYRKNLVPFLEWADTHAKFKYDVLNTASHVAWQHYGVLTADGGTTTDYPEVKTFIDDWATGNPSWTSVK